MCEIAGLEIRKLRRVAIITPHITLELGKLRLGEWRYLTRDEVKLLAGVSENAGSSENSKRRRAK